MKISNKTRVVNYNLTILMFILLFLLLYASRHILSGFVPSGTVKMVLGVTSVIVLMSIVLMLRVQMVFEFENNGQVITIKSYRWFLAKRNMIISPVFEMPKTKIFKMRIQNMLFKKYLKIYFEGNSGILKKISIDVTGCSQQHIKDILMDTSILMNQS